MITRKLNPVPADQKERTESGAGTKYTMAKVLERLRNDYCFYIGLLLELFPTTALPIVTLRLSMDDVGSLLAIIVVRTLIISSKFTLSDYKGA